MKETIMKLVYLAIFLPLAALTAIFAILALLFGSLAFGTNWLLSNEEDVESFFFAKHGAK